MGLSKWVLPLCWVLILSGLAQWIRLVLLIGFPADLTLNESSATLGAWHWLNGNLAYPDWREYPHRLNPYGPLNMMGPALLCRAVYGSADWAWLYFLARAQSVLAMSCGAGMVGWAVCVAVGQWRAAFAGAGLALVAWPMVTAACVHGRPDAPAAALGMAAVLLAGRGRFWLAGGVAACALGCKANALASALVVGMIAAERLGFLRAVGGATLIGLVSSGLLLLWQALTGERYLDQAATCGDVGWNLANWWLYLGMLRDPDRLQIFSLDVALRILMMAGAGGAFLQWKGFWSAASSRKRFLGGAVARVEHEAVGLTPSGEILVWTPVRCLAWLGVISLLLNGVLLLKVGSGANYFLESVMALSAPAVGGLVIFYRGRHPLRLWVSGVAGLTLLVTLPGIAWAVGQVGAHVTLTQKPLEAPMAAPKGSLLADLAFVHPDPDTRLMNDPFYVALLINRGQLDPAGIVERIRKHQYPEIYMSPMMRSSFTNGPSRAVLEVIEQAYRPTYRGVVYVRYIPRRQ